MHAPELRDAQNRAVTFGVGVTARALCFFELGCTTGNLAGSSGGARCRPPFRPARGLVTSASNGEWRLVFERGPCRRVSPARRAVASVASQRDPSDRHPLRFSASGTRQPLARRRGSSTPYVLEPRKSQPRGEEGWEGVERVAAFRFPGFALGNEDA